MNRMTAVGLFTCVVLTGCAHGDDEAAPGATVAAQQVETNDRTVHGAVRGTYGGTPFTAVVTVTEFLVRNGAVRAVGTLGTFAGGLTQETAGPLSRTTFDFPVSVGPIVLPQVVVMPDGGANGVDAGLTGLCDVLYVRFPPQTLDVEGRALDLEEIQLDVDATPAVDTATGRLLCEVSALLDPAGSLGGPTLTNVTRAVAILNTVVKANREALPPDGGTFDVPAIDAGAKPPAPSYDASVPIKL